MNGYGNALDNVLTGNGGVNTLAAGDGNDTLYGQNGNDKLYGDGGDDHVYGGIGNDLLYGWTGKDWLQGDDGNDQLYGDEGDDVEFGGAGDDKVFGWSGNDYLSGGAGIDDVEGEAGNDLLQGGAGADTLYDVDGANLFDAGADADKLTGGAAAELFIGSGGNDTITTGSGADVIAFNKGDGQDTVIASVGLDNSISVGGGISYSDMTLTKSGNNLVFKLGATDQITLKDWYTVGSAGENYKSVASLQVIAEAMSAFDADSTNSLINKKVETFDFGSVVATYDQARVTNPTLSNWALTNALAQFQLSGSDAAALGGDLAYQYGKSGSLAGIGVAPAQDVINAAQFGTQAQALRPLAGLQQGELRLG